MFSDNLFFPSCYYFISLFLFILYWKQQFSEFPLAFWVKSHSDTCLFQNLPDVFLSPALQHFSPLLLVFPSFFLGQWLRDQSSSVFVNQYREWTAFGSPLPTWGLFESFPHIFPQRRWPLSSSAPPAYCTRIFCGADSLLCAQAWCTVLLVTGYHGGGRGTIILGVHSSQAGSFQPQTAFSLWS